MKSPVLLLAHSLVLIGKILRPGGFKALVAENPILKQQLIVLNRARQRATNLRAIDRFLFGMLFLVVGRKRLRSVAVIIKPATPLKFHSALVKRKHRRLFGNNAHRRPGPKGPSREVIVAIVELKQRNTRNGCPTIAYVVSLTFGVEINKDIVRRVLAKHYKLSPGNSVRRAKAPSLSG